MQGFYETKADQNDYIFIFYFESTKINAHFHKSLEIVYCIEGKTEVFVNGKKMILNANEMYFAPSYTVHYNRNQGHNKILSFVFSHNFFHDFEKTYPNMTFDNALKNHEKNKKIFLLLQAIHDTHWKYQQKIPFLKQQALINDLLFELALVYPLIQIKQKKIDSIVLDILTYIDTHYQDEIDLHFLAQRYNYCPQYFSELFNKNVGHSLKSYLNNIRIEHAMAEIENPNNKKTLTQIAFEHGFTSLPTFYRCLREKRGL